MKWKIYYDDLSTFSDEDGSWEEAPHKGALVLTTSDPEVGREIDHGARGEFFAWAPGATKPWGFDRVGILDYLSQRGWPESTLLSDVSIEDLKEEEVKIGRSVDNIRFREVLDLAAKDNYFETKSAYTTREHTE